ncbi:MAG: serine protease, partial [Actinobacteria bacterium]|nr:serine protease [Actinomycetota bacterium]
METALGVPRRRVLRRLVRRPAGLAGLVLTAGHVVDRAGGRCCETRVLGSDEWLSGELVWRGEGCDAALLRVSAGDRGGDPLSQLGRLGSGEPAACRALGAVTLDAGLAATGDRLAVATALATAGLPRPETRLACSPEAALLALAEFGYPGTLLPLAAGAPPVVLHDADAAEAVLE